uniref:Uncharacterized protein n=1 Tax=Oryza rufipogon TaxID=4529 RepID=A0A0E0QGS1_ORYRU
MALYELAVFDPSNPVLDPMWRQGITNSWGGWSVSEGTATNPGVACFGFGAFHVTGLYGLGIRESDDNWNIRSYSGSRVYDNAEDGDCQVRRKEV